MPPDSFPPTPRGKERRASLLRAAETVFGRSGYAHATIADITRLAETAQGTFYIYFDSKTHVFTELVAELGASLRRELAQASASCSSRLEAERAGLAAFLSMIRARPEMFAIVEEARSVAPEAYRGFYETLADSYAAKLAAAQSEGEIAQGNTHVRAWALIGLSRTLGERYALWETDADHDAIVQSAVDFIRDGIGLR